MLTLRPDIPLSYVGILDKCFEILEDSGTSKPPRDEWPWSLGANPDIDADENADDGVTGDHVVEVVESDPDDEDELAGTQISDEEGSETGSSENESDDGGKSKVQLRCREILFYDDKVSIFKVRHGRL